MTTRSIPGGRNGCFQAFIDGTYFVRKHTESEVSKFTSGFWCSANRMMGRIRGNLKESRGGHVCFSIVPFDKLRAASAGLILVSLYIDFF